MYKIILASTLCSILYCQDAPPVGNYKYIERDVVYKIEENNKREVIHTTPVSLEISKDKINIVFKSGDEIGHLSMEINDCAMSGNKFTITCTPKLVFEEEVDGVKNETPMTGSPNVIVLVVSEKKLSLFGNDKSHNFDIYERIDK